MPTSKGRSPRGSKNRQRDAGADKHKQAERDKQARLGKDAKRDRSGKKPKARDGYSEGDLGLLDL